MPDPGIQYDRTGDGQAAHLHATPPPPFPRVVCANCSADLTLLPTAARVCNRCGASLSAAASATAPAPAVAQAPSGPAFSRPRWLFNLWFACSDCGPEGASGLAGRSAMLLAYGKSLFNLGWRYEHALGARRNLSEAARCYLKAARLGDHSAVGRLASTGAAALPEGISAPASPLPLTSPAIPIAPPLARVYDGN